MKRILFDGLHRHTYDTTFYRLAMAEARKAADEAMEKAGRKTWTVDEYNLATNIANDLLDQWGQP